MNNLFVNANEEQRKRFLPAMCSGAAIGGVCISEPDGGTDVLGMRTTAVRKGDHYVLNGRKMWITNGAINGGTSFFMLHSVQNWEMRFLSTQKSMGKSPCLL